AVGSWQKEKKQKSKANKKITTNKGEYPIENEPGKGKPSHLPGTALQIEAFGSTEPFLQKGFGPPEASLYKTGDLARWLPDGNIEFLGRIDHQVKIRGFRIELREIENHLLSHKDIKETVVLANKDNSGDKFLCAYFTTWLHSSPGSQDASVYREYLSQCLPDYMIPSSSIKMEKIPLTANGKVDRKALSKFQISNTQYRTYTAPRNES
ncbi:MAG: AMP-binding protein, partial [bacterium]|nr:AMP-binding protein [bacterium]